MGNNNSHDSAIDTDLQEWETEILDFDIVCNFVLSLQKFEQILEMCKNPSFNYIL